MKAYSEPALKIMASHLLHLQQENILQTGDAFFTVYGLRLIGINVHVQQLLIQDNLDLVPKLLRKLRSRFDVVCTASEAWSAPDTTVRPSEHPLRKECICIVLYSKGATHTLMANISRDPLRFENSRFEKTKISGRLSAAG